MIGNILRTWIRERYQKYFDLLFTVGFAFTVTAYVRLYTAVLFILFHTSFLGFNLFSLLPYYDTRTACSL